MDNIYAVYDVRAEMYNTPFFMTRDGLALRAFSDLANDKRTSVGMHPEDYKLVCLGTFDRVNGYCKAEDPRTLGFGSDFVQRESVLKEVK